MKSHVRNAGRSVGETKRILRVRLGEHKQAVKRGNSKKGIAVHAHETHHEINWNGAEVKKMEANYWKRRTFEVIQIKASSETMNLDSGLQFPSIWNPILKPPYVSTTHHHPFIFSYPSLINSYPNFYA